MKTPQSILQFFTRDYWENSTWPFKSGFYRPLTLFSYWLNYQMGGGTPFVFHLINVILHALNGILVFSLILSLSNNRPVSFLTAIFFLIHPVQTETVAFISDRGDLLSVLFLLLSCYTYFLSTVGKSVKKNYIFSLAFLFLAFLSKENAMVGAGLIALIDYYFVSQLDWQVFLRRWKCFAPHFILTVFYVLLRTVILGPLNAVATLHNVRYISILPAFDWMTHLMMIAKILMLYIKMFFYPVTQSISYFILPPIFFWDSQVFLPTILLGVVAVLAFVAMKGTMRWVSFTIAWIGITLVPFSNLIPISNTIAERFMYLPSIGFCWLLSGAIDCLKQKVWMKPILRGALLTAVTVLFCFLSSKTISRNRVWHDNYALFTSALNLKPCSPIADNNLNSFYNFAGNTEKAREHYYRGIACVEIIRQEYRARKEAYRQKKLTDYTVSREWFGH